MTLLHRIVECFKPLPPPEPLPDLERHDRAIAKLRQANQRSRRVQKAVATGNLNEDLITGLYQEERK